MSGVLKGSRPVLARVLLSTSVLASGPVFAESGHATGGAASVSARVNFSIKVPSFIRFRVGSASATPDTVAFDLTADPAALADALRDDTALHGTGGDQDGGAVTVQLVSNVGNVQITAITDGTGLSDGGTNTIPYTDIVTSAAGNPILPALSATGSSVTVTASNGSIVHDAAGTYTYHPTALPAPASYTGSVTYTAAMP